jgi:Flp pilus assembly pilin Flp
LIQIRRIQIHRIQSAVRDASEEGQALVEYALILGAIAIFTITSLQLLGGNVSALLNQVASGFGGV